MNCKKTRLLKNLVFAFILLALKTSLLAQDLANYSSSFVDIGFGARPLGMGGAYSALANDANAVAWNPAGIMEVKGFDATFSYARQFGLIPYSYGAVAYSFSPTFAFGGGTIIAGDDLLKEVSIIANLATRFQLDKYPLNIGITIALHNASYGKNDPENLSVQGDAIGYSIGVGAQFFLSQNIVLASHIQNMANHVTWNSSTIGKYAEGLPQKWTIGVGFKDFHQFNFDLDIQKSLYQEIDDKFFIGAERELVQKLFLRGGAASSINQSERLFYSFGIGFNQNLQEKFIFQVDAAYIIHSLENMFRLSLSFRID